MKRSKRSLFSGNIVSIFTKNLKNLITFNLNFIIIDMSTKKHHKDISQDDKIHKIIYHFYMKLLNEYHAKHKIIHKHMQKL